MNTSLLVMPSHETLLERIERKTALVSIIGLGYVGLPLAQAFVRKGFSVLGFDCDRAKVDCLEQGRSYIGHISDACVRKMRAEHFSATDQFDRLHEADVILICVPTPLKEAREPDLGFVLLAAQAISAQLRPGQLIVLESTTYPGTTRQVVLTCLEKSGLRAGSDFFLAYSPEREDPGSPDHSLANIPKVVGGLDSASFRLAAALYSQIVPRVIQVSTPEIAEASKILENTYRAVNIALVNELKILFDRLGVNVWEVIEAAQTKPFGFQAFYPGPGLGGHCIPIDPFYLTWLARRHGLSTKFIELAGEINTAMPRYVVDKITDALNQRCRALKGSRIAILGMAYKKDVDDPRESPGFELMDLLQHKGADDSYHDPHIPELPSMRRYPHLLMVSKELSPRYLQNQDCVVIVTDHSAYEWDWIVANSTLVVDTRNATRHVSIHRERIVLA